MVRGVAAELLSHAHVVLQAGDVTALVGKERILGSVRAYCRRLVHCWRGMSEPTCVVYRHIMRLDSYSRY